MNVVDDGGVHPVPFSPERFDYGKNDFAERIPPDIGYAGLRIHYPLKSPSYLDEVIVFLGASYFRAARARQRLRALGARPGDRHRRAERARSSRTSSSSGWSSPPPDATSLVALRAARQPERRPARTASRSSPASQTRVEVEARLFPRRAVAQARHRAAHQHVLLRREHARAASTTSVPRCTTPTACCCTSTSGEWLWRPLDNPPRIDVEQLRACANPRGFGLLQRDRDFASYQDIETRSELRPSAWIEPRGDWGDGPRRAGRDPDRHRARTTTSSPSGFPTRRSQPGEPLAFAYALSWYGDDPARPPGGRVVATRRDRGTVPDGHRFVIDFDGEQLRAIPADDRRDAEVTVAGGSEARRAARPARRQESRDRRLAPHLPGRARRARSRSSCAPI